MIDLPVRWRWVFEENESLGMVFHQLPLYTQREREPVFMYELGLAFWLLVLLLLLRVGLSSSSRFRARWLIKEVWVLLKCAVRAHLVSKNTENYAIFGGTIYAYPSRLMSNCTKPIIMVTLDIVMVTHVECMGLI